MKEYIIRVPQEADEIVTAVMEKFGVKATEIKKRKTPQKQLKKKKTPEKISPTYLFGKWKNLEIDAKKLRHESWDRSHKFL